MASRDLPGLGLKGDWDLGEHLWKDDMDANLLWLSVLQGGSISNVLAAEPGAPAEGDIIALDETHATNPNELAVYDEAAWRYRIVPVGTRMWNEVTETYWQLGALAWEEAPEASKAYVDAAIAAIAGGFAALNSVLSGCVVTYSGTGLTWNLTAGEYILDGEVYDATEQSVALDAADATHPRFDALVLDDAGVFGKVTGTAAANPSFPSVDPAEYLILTYVFVAATVTDLTGTVTDEIIYDENDDWVASTSGAGWDPDSIVAPFAGAKAIEATAVAAGSYVQLTRASNLPFGGDGTLYFRIRSKAVWNAKRTLLFQFRDANNAALGSQVTLKDGEFGFNSANVAGYQLLAIPKSLFAISAATNVRAIRVTAGGSGGAAIGFHIDPIVLQTLGTGASNPSASQGMTQEQADARYRKRINIQAVVSAATVTPTFENDLVKITAQAAALALANWSGTPEPGWSLAIRIKDDGTARAVTYGSKYRAIGVTLPATTVINKTLYLAAIYNSDDDKFDVIAVRQEA